MYTYENPGVGLGLVGPVITEGEQPFELELIDLLLEPPLAGGGDFEVALSLDILTFKMSVDILTKTGNSRRINADQLTHSDSERESHVSRVNGIQSVALS